TLRIHLEAVARAEIRENLRGCPGDATEVDEFGEESLKAGRRDDLQNPGRLITRVPERVPLVAGLEHQIPWVGDQHFVTEKRAHPALEHVAVLVFTRVPVQRGGQSAGGHRMLDQRESLARLRPADNEPAADHEPGADAPEEPRLAVARSDNLC